MFTKGSQGFLYLWLLKLYPNDRGGNIMINCETNNINKKCNNCHNKECECKNCQDKCNCGDCKCNECNCEHCNTECKHDKK